MSETQVFSVPVRFLITKVILVPSLAANTKARPGSIAWWVRSVDSGANCLR